MITWVFVCGVVCFWRSLRLTLPYSGGAGAPPTQKLTTRRDSRGSHFFCDVWIIRFKVCRSYRSDCASCAGAKCAIYTGVPQLRDATLLVSI